MNEVHFSSRASTEPDPPTCDQTGDDEGQHQHLQHPHEQLSRKGKVLDLSQGQFVGAQAKAKDHT